MQAVRDTQMDTETDRQTDRQEDGKIAMDRETMSKQTFLYKLMCTTNQLQVVNVHKLQQPHVSYHCQ